MSLTEKELEYFSEQLPKGYMLIKRDRLKEKLNDILHNQYMLSCLLEASVYYPQQIRAIGNRMDFCSTLAIEFTEMHLKTNWGDKLLWEEELEKFLSSRLKALED